MMHRLRFDLEEKDRRIKIRIDHRYSKKESHVKKIPIYQRYNQE